MGILNTNNDERYVIVKEDGDSRFYPYIDASNGCYVPPSKILEIVKDLLSFCQEYTEEEIVHLNTGIRLSTEYELKWDITHRVGGVGYKNVGNSSGYIYLLECGGTYKIGYSRNVNQRIKTLDTRPFKLKLINKWYSDYARAIEVRLHYMLDGYRLEGEWYSSSLPVKTLGDLIKELERGMRQCDIH